MPRLVMLYERVKKTYLRDGGLRIFTCAPRNMVLLLLIIRVSRLRIHGATLLFDSFEFSGEQYHDYTFFFGGEYWLG